MYEGVLPACMYMHHMLAWHPGRPEEGVGFLRTRITEGSELPCVF